MKMEKKSRRQALKHLAVGSAGLVALSNAACAPKENSQSETIPTPEKKAMKGNINHSVCQWCYGKIPLEELVLAAKEMGITSIDLLGPDQWSVAQKHGLTCAMAYGSSLNLTKGFNDTTLHAQLLQEYSESIPKAAAAGLKNVICFSGNRNGISDEQGLEKLCQRFGTSTENSPAAQYYNGDGIAQQ